ncbi:MAG: VapC toxin family PIN domain ribonuclease, partial [Chloroflexi bacterium]|nr:VapC toxin family PIN domain ribonuclease [Chloroflexota bacterium]
MVKLVQREAESDALRRYLRAHRADKRVACEVVRVEVVRSIMSGGPPAIAHARRQLARLYLMVMDRELLDRAATLAPAAVLPS